MGQTERPETEALAMEVLRHERERSKAKNIGVICVTIALVIVTIWLSVINYRNDREWRELFSSYDFVTQDGSGQNYYNNDIGGNVNNGAANNTEEEQENSQRGGDSPER